MKKSLVIAFYLIVSAITAVEAIAAIYALSCNESLWGLIAIGAVCGGIIAYALGKKVFGDLAKDMDEDYDE